MSPEGAKDFMTVHVVTSSLDPRGGGMAESALRICGILAALEYCRVVVYLRRPVPAEMYGLPPSLEVVDLSSLRQDLLEGFGTDTVIQWNESYRLDCLLLKKAIMARMEGGSDVLISFYISSSGFIAQQVGLMLSIPHVATIRGTDFSRDFFNPRRLHAIEFVVRHAEWIVTTNLSQERALRRHFGRTARIRTIYNSLAEGGEEALWAPSWRERVEIFADCGYAGKKGTQILLDAFLRTVEAGVDCRLTVVGDVDERARDYWQRRRSHLLSLVSDKMVLQDWVPKNEVERLLRSADIYATATLGEGCSNGSLCALAFGIPLVGTQCGALADLGGGMSHVSLAAPGDAEGFRWALENMIKAVGNKTVEVDREKVRALRRDLNGRKERSQWEEIVKACLARGRVPAKSRQRRILFFVHDGGGLGHLRRVSRVAGSLQGECSCLVISGHRAAAWMVPERCEYVHIPSLDSLFRSKASYWGRDPFLEMARTEIVPFRQRIIEGIFEAFRPDAIVVDYLPTGKYGELDEVIARSDALKYLILRGVLDEIENVRSDILGGQSQELVEEEFDRIFVACDRRICDVADEYGFSDAIARKLRYIGYISDRIPENEILSVRSERGLTNRSRWIVCSAGGGRLGERLIEECVRISHKMSEEFAFDIIAGPKSTLKLAKIGTASLPEARVRLMGECKELPLLHAAADIVVCNGGYNSLVEAMEGGALVVTSPAPKDGDPEQYIHSARLADFYPVAPLHDLATLRETIENMLNGRGERRSGREVLDFGGLRRIRRILLEDLASG